MSKKIFITYITYLLLTLIGSLISFLYFNGNELKDFLNLNKLLNDKIDFQNITFSYGEIINNLKNYNEYYLTLGNVKLYIAKPPFIPFFLLLIHQITASALGIFLIKNIIIFTIYFFCVLNYKREDEKLSYYLWLCIFLVPYNFYQSTLLIPEESYSNLLIPSIFLILISEKKNELLFLIILAILLFCKSTNIILVTFILIYAFLYDKKDYHYKKKIILILLFFVISWSFYGYKKSKIVALGHKAYTINYFTGLQSHNLFFKYLYPIYSVDNVDEYFNFFYKDISNEKQFVDKFSLEMKKFILNNPVEYFSNKLKIINHSLINIRKDGSNLNNECKLIYKKILKQMEIDKKIYSINENLEILFKQKCIDNYNAKIIVDYILNKMIWIIALVLAFINLIFSKLVRESFLFLLFNFFYLAPFITGHIYTRHLVVLFFLSLIYLGINFRNKFRIKTMNY